MNTNKWLSFYKPKPQARLRLFCFPHAGGGASSYRLWSKALPPEIDVCPVQLPGRENRVMDLPLGEIDALLESLTIALKPYWDIPFVFFGHSFGALISFEFIRHLRREHGVQPVHFCVSGYQAPPITNKLPPISHLPDDEFIDGLRELDSTPEAVFEHMELMELLLPALRADFEIYEKYEYSEEKPFECPISAFGGRKDPLVLEDDLESWRNHTDNLFSVRMFPGDHFYLHGSDRKPLLEAISEDLKKQLV